MLQRRLAHIDVNDMLDQRELCKGQPLVQTINAAKGDVAKRWYFYLKNFQPSKAEWVVPYTIAGGSVLSPQFHFGASLAGESFLLGFASHSIFRGGLLELRNIGGAALNRYNSTCEADLDDHLLIYQAHDQKHHINSAKIKGRETVSPMDLRADIAQRVLTCSIAVEGWGRLGCYRGQFYEFFLTEDNIYHGWRMPDNERAKLSEAIQQRLVEIDAYERPS